MTYHELHALAERIEKQDRITHSQALAKLARRSAAKRRANSAKLKRGPFAHVESPAKPYWWQKLDA